MPFRLIAALAAMLCVFGGHSQGLMAQQPATTPVRTVLALTALPSVVDGPRFFRLWKIELPPGKASSLGGPVGFVYVLSGALSVDIQGRQTTLSEGDGLALPGGRTHAIVAQGNAISVFLHFVLAGAKEIEHAPAGEPARANEIYRSPEPIPHLQSGPYEFTLTRVAFPSRMPLNAPHYRSGAALY